MTFNFLWEVHTPITVNFDVTKHNPVWLSAIYRTLLAFLSLLKNVKIKETSFWLPTDDMDYLLHAACVTLKSWGICYLSTGIWPLTNLFIGNVTLMANYVKLHLKASKTDATIYGIKYTVVQIKQHFEIMSIHLRDPAKSLHWRMHLLTHWFWMRRAVLWAEQTIFFISFFNKFLRLGYHFTLFRGCFFQERSLISYCGQ